MKCYYFDSDKQQQGPYPDLWVSQLIHSGVLDDKVQIWGEQIGEWMTWEDYISQSQHYIECPYCASQLYIEKELFEKKLQCPECNKKFIVNAQSNILLWDLFDTVKLGGMTFCNIDQWISAWNKSQTKASSEIKANNLSILTPDYIYTLISQRDEQKLSQVNQIVVCQIFLLCCLILNKQLKRTSILEFREYCVLSGLSAISFDKILSCELAKAFVAVNHNCINYNEIYYFKSIAEYYSNSIKNEKGVYFIPAYNALIPWYCNAFVKKISCENFVTCLDEFQKLASLPDFSVYSRMLKEVSFQQALEKIICSKIEDGNFTKTDFIKLSKLLSPLPFGMEWLFNSSAIQATLCNWYLKKFDLLLQGKESVLPDFVYDMLADTAEVENKIAKKLLPIIVDKKKSFTEVKFIFEVLDNQGFGMSYGKQLFTLKRIFPYLLSDDSSVVFKFPVLLARQEELVCPACTGHGKEVCPQCNGTKKMDCPECGGKGTVYSFKTHRDIYCPKCQGRKKITCDNNCQGDRNITGDLQYYIKCKLCNGAKKVTGMETVCTGEFVLEQNRCFIIDDKSQAIPFELPFKQKTPLKHMDKTMASYCKDKDCFFFSDKSGKIFCGEQNQEYNIAWEYMLGVVSKFYTRQSKNKSPKNGEPINVTIEEKSSEKKVIELAQNEKLYLKSYMVANKDGVIDEAERKMLEYQALNILKLSPERIVELEALVQFLDEGEI